jgi:DUF1009 family protein
MRQARASVLAIEAVKVLVFDKEDVAREADKNSISIIAV